MFVGYQFLRVRHSILKMSTMSSNTIAVWCCSMTIVSTIAWMSYTEWKKRVKKELKEETTPSSVYITTATTSTNSSETASPRPSKIPVRILYATQTGTAKGFAETLQRSLFALNLSGFHFETSVVNMKEYDQDNLEHEGIVICILSTWTGGVCPADGRLFTTWLNDMATDFRVSKSWLKATRYAVFGLGNDEYDGDFCQAAKGALVRCIDVEVLLSIVFY